MLRRIVNIDADALSEDLVPQRDCEGLFVIFWRGPVPLGHFDLPNAVLPVSADRLRSLIPGPVPMPAASQHRVSVVVCTRDRPELLRRCLGALTRLTPSPHEILIVDNAPRNDHTRHVVEATPGIRYLLEPRPGLDHARNAGIRGSTGDIVAFTDDDVVVAPSWLEGLWRGFDRPEVMAVTGPVLPGELQTDAQWHFEQYWSLNKGYERRLFDPAWFAAHKYAGAPVWMIGAGANMAFRREIFDRIGGFDERLDVGAAGCCGDSEIWHRILAGGGTCLYEPSAVVRHFHRRDLEGLKRQIRGYMSGHVAALLIQYERCGDLGSLCRLGVVLPYYYSRWTFRGLRNGFRGRYATLWEEIRGCAEGVRFYRNSRQQRSRLTRRA